MPKSNTLYPNRQALAKTRKNSDDTCGKILGKVIAERLPTFKIAMEGDS
jgi:hypothetical protein